MTAFVTNIVERICEDDPKYAPVLRSHLAKMGETFGRHASDFFERYKAHIERRGKSMDFGLRCFKALRVSVLEERIAFMRTGAYANKSFEDVKRRVYHNPEIMTVYMHGLVFAQFFWPEQYRRFEFFCEHLGEYRANARAYLEVGGGHGLYVRQARRELMPDTLFDVVDISPSSLELAHGIVGDDRVTYHLNDISSFATEHQYDFITVGEVLEHLERPQELLHKVRDLLTKDGTAYITTPANAPMLDHIYLFNDADEIRVMLASCGFTIEHEVTQYAVHLPAHRHKALKTALMFGAFVKKAQPHRTAQRHEG